RGPAAPEWGKVVDPAEVALPLGAGLGGRPGRVRRGREPLPDHVMRLAAEGVLAAPVARGRNRHARAELAALHKGLIAGDEDEVVDDRSRTVAGCGNCLAGKGDFFDRPVLRGN